VDDSIVSSLEALKQELESQKKALQTQGAQLERVQRAISQQEVSAGLPLPLLLSQSQYFVDFPSSYLRQQAVTNKVSNPLRNSHLAVGGTA